MKNDLEQKEIDRILENESKKPMQMLLIALIIIFSFLIGFFWAFFNLYL
jgi:hypothetical protein